MDIQAHLDAYLAAKRQQRADVFEEAASTSVLMFGVKYLCKHFYHLFDWYCRVYMSLMFRLKGAPGDLAKTTGKFYADAIDTYHVLWVIITFVLYLIGWQIYYTEGETYTDWLLWIIPIGICVYRIFEILAALVEMYFRASDTKHHQFRILIHASLHYLAAGFAFALFYIFIDWGFESFTAENAAGKVEYQFDDWSEPIFNSLMTIVAFSGNDEPQNWQGKLLTLLELFLGFILVTFIFLNITQVWLGNREEEN